MTTRELNRALLARQLLLERVRLPVPRAVDRLCALQAQYPPSPYVALWSRLDAFESQALTRALEERKVFWGTLLRSTLHIVSAGNYPAFAAAWFPQARRDAERRGADVSALRRALPEDPRPAGELREIAGRALGTDDRTRIGPALRALPLVRAPGSGQWAQSRELAAELWRGKLPSQGNGTQRLVRSALAAFGPMTRKDVAHFTYLKMGQIDEALEKMRKIEAEDGRVLYDVPRAPRPPAGTPAPIRFLHAFDSAILAHDDRTRILPGEYHDRVIRQQNITTLATFLVDGFVAGSWSVQRTKTKATLALEPFERLPPKTRREVVAEGERLVRFLAEDATSYAVR
jgi:Winged helix DNA-binding domain